MQDSSSAAGPAARMSPGRSPAGRPLAAELVQQAGRVVARVRDPRAKALRRRRRARRATVVRSGITLVAAAVTAVIGSSSGIELSEVLAGSVAVAAGLRAVAAGNRWARLSRAPLPPPAPEPPPPLPPPGSAAREPLTRLAEAEAALADLLDVLARPRGGTPAVLPAEAVESTRVAVAEAATSLRGTGQTIEALERAARGGRPELGDGVAALRRDLDAGVDEVWALVAAAGAVVTAAGAGNRPSALAEATDRLSGLALGLRELSHRTA